MILLGTLFIFSSDKKLDVNSLGFMIFKTQDYTKLKIKDFEFVDFKIVK